MHRNTLLFISFLAVVAALLFGFNIGRLSGQPTTNNNLPSTTQAPTPIPKITLATYTNSLCGISFEYPNSLTKLEATSGAMFVDTKVASSSVALACQEEIPRLPLPEEKIETFIVTSTSGASISAKLYHDASAKDGTPIDKLIFTNPKTGLDVLIAGLGTAFQQILNTLKVL